MGYGGSLRLQNQYRDLTLGIVIDQTKNIKKPIKQLVRYVSSVDNFWREMA